MKKLLTIAILLSCIGMQAQNIIIHDPVMARENGKYYLFATGRGVQILESTDMQNWTNAGSVFNKAPEWAVKSVPGYRGHTWAPDIQRVGDKWWLFYSCSSFGKNTSAIGLAVNKTLDKSSADYEWIDKGVVVRSEKGRTDWNAIDPNMIVDKKDKKWLCWGSFWDGIQLAKLKNAETEAFDKEKIKGKPITIARRHPSKNDIDAADLELADEAPDAGPNAIEAPFIVYNNGYYYLFASWDYCCKGPRSTYKTVVGRSRDIKGPYLDRNGRDMAKGGGDIILAADSSYYGIGHCGVYDFDGKWYIVAHGYDRADFGASKLFLRQLFFDEDGWVRVGTEPINATKHQH